MQASGRPVAKLMRDVRAVRWLSLAQATARLTHEREKLFLEKVGRQVVRQTSSPKRKARKSAISRRKKATAVRKRAGADAVRPSVRSTRGDQAASGRRGAPGSRRSPLSTA